MTQFSMIEMRRDGDVGVIMLARPERMNATVPQMIVEIDRALTELSDARAILFTGAGRGFCAGADLSARTELTPPGMTDGEAARDRLLHHYNPLFTRIARLPIPVIMAVNGPAVGVGCSLALLGDIVIAADTAYFLQAFVNIGLVPDGGASWMLPRLIGKARAYEMMLLGERISAEKAVDWGLIHRAVPGEELIDTALELAKKLAAGPTLAIGLMRQNINASLDSSFAEALALEAQGQRIAADSVDNAEAVQAFAEKRKPVFVGR